MVTYKFKTKDYLEAQQIINASNMANALFEISNNLWRKWKHDEEGLNIDTLREEIQLILNDCNLNIDSIS